MRNRRFVFILFSFFITGYLFSQKQYNIWYFGTGGIMPSLSGPGAGMDFNSGSPIALSNSKMDFTEGCAGYCNSAGQLLFYTNGDSVWNRNQHTMLNGGNLGGNVSSMQSCVIIPFKTDTNKFYIFSNDGFPTGNGTGLYYSVVDMSLDGGLGGITSVKKVHLLNGTAERLTAVMHCSGSDYWVITNPYLSNVYYAYLVSDSGIIDTVKSTVGPINKSGVGNPGHIKASPLKNRLATWGTDNNSIPYTVLFDFNNTTGQLSNPFNIEAGDGGMSQQGISFSPDGKLFYLASGPIVLDIYQFDLTAANINASQLKIGTSSGTATEPVYDMQIGPDNKLYIGHADPFSTLHSLDAINNPNIKGSGCGLVNNAVNLSGRTSWLSLPNIITSYLIPGSNSNSMVDFIFSGSTNCVLDTISFSDASVNTYSWSWDFGDISSGIQNNSTLQNPKHVFTAEGNYSVTLTNNCILTSKTKAIIINSCSNDPIQVPNIITKNNDGRNDQFLIKGISESGWNLEIVDRWGNVVFSRVNYNNDWSAENLTDGVYYYTLRNATKNSHYTGFVYVVG